MKKCCLNCAWYDRDCQLCLWAFENEEDGPMISVFLPERKTSCSKYEEATTK